MKILFVNLSGMRFTVATPDSEPLGGTESALSYLARQLAKNGHEVSLVCKAPDNAPETVMGVRHVAPTALLNSDFLAAQNFEIIIALNAALAGPSLRAMAPGALILLWDHLAPDHSAIAQLDLPVTRDSYDGIIYVSNWQRKVTEEMVGFKKPAAIIGNGFAPAFEDMFSSAAELRAAKENRAAYTTTPFRGLPILIDVMAQLKTGTKLDIYSSMKVYQSAKDDEQYAPLYARAAANPLITSHGAVAQAELAKRLKPLAFFTYPSIYAETFCIAALEARAAGLKVLTTGGGALPEVLGSSADYVRASLEKPDQLIADFGAMLRGNVERFLKEPGLWAEERFADVQNVNRSCTWAKRAEEWEKLLTSRNFS